MWWGIENDVRVHACCNPSFSVGCFGSRSGLMSMLVNMSECVSSLFVARVKVLNSVTSERASDSM